ncbi:haem-degrading [Lucifera butyrica]|uniref:UPF0303 protein LUCI_2266 n=1 Tax=Lucifera butyrica TaxID=1351585 RepID=A0A498R9S5_9FIRM|nr:heme-degrading domain-containing protein [Lucifera butyrica]VBB07022.1 haem-degrading [Lucifera butyrica]
MEDLQELLTQVKNEEELLQFASFTNETALALGTQLANTAAQKGKAVTVDICRNGQQLFHYAMTGTSADNDAWIQRKNRVVNRFGHSSYYVGLLLRSQEKTMENKYLLPESDYAPHGGAFPLRIKNVGVVGTITVSGLPQREDHELIVGVLKNFLGLPD